MSRGLLPLTSCNSKKFICLFKIQMATYMWREVVRKICVEVEQCDVKRFFNSVCFLPHFGFWQFGSAFQNNRKKNSI